ncbi:MAG: ATP-binding cassette domain-containing protein [Alphaproteobacteria bacterium]|nr:ATP-binding cassette domain-containing protein [Alphaproteobacteria bacterium]
MTSVAVTVRGVSYAYGEGAARKTVLDEVDLTLRRGEFAVLTGHSGAGKTTLLTLIGAIRSLQQGQINVLGFNLAGRGAIAQEQVRRQIGFIFQDHNLFSALSAFRTLWLTSGLSPSPPSRQEALSRATALLEALGMGSYLHSMPGQLSTGQKQRIAVARALMNTPQLILGDEPTAALDHDASMLVISLIRQHLTTNGASALIVTHDDRIFPMADRVLYLRDGRLVNAA